MITLTNIKDQHRSILQGLAHPDWHIELSLISDFTTDIFDWYLAGLYQSLHCLVSQWIWDRLHRFFPYYQHLWHISEYTLLTNCWPGYMLTEICAISTTKYTDPTIIYRLLGLPSSGITILPVTAGYIMDTLGSCMLEITYIHLMDTQRSYTLEIKMI